MTTLTIFPTSETAQSAGYSLLDDLGNLTVTDSQGNSFDYNPKPPYGGWYLLEPGWGRVCDARSLSGHTVGGIYLPGQVLIHPVSENLPTVLTREFQTLSYAGLTVTFALADGAVSGSDGVALSVTLIEESGEIARLLDRVHVAGNQWSQQTLDISRYVGKPVILRLEVDAFGSLHYDWLEIQLTMSK